jgi:CDP-6-deoxy-D-xylo-4-hexulose-3-dehydrase
MNNTLWLGVYPGLTPEMLNYMIESVHEYVQDHQRKSNG